MYERPDNLLVLVPICKLEHIVPKAQLPKIYIGKPKEPLIEN